MAEALRVIGRQELSVSHERRKFLIRTVKYTLTPIKHPKGVYRFSWHVLHTDLKVVAKALVVGRPVVPEAGFLAPGRQNFPDAGVNRRYVLTHRHPGIR